LRHDAGLRHDDIQLHGLELIFKRLDEEIDIFVNEKDAVFRMIDNVNQMFNGQADIERMQNGAHAGNAEVKLQVAMVIQREGGHPVAFLEAESAQGARQLTGAFVPVGIRITESPVA
jgi:hypothetical protein